MSTNRHETIIDIALETARAEAGAKRIEALLERLAATAAGIRVGDGSLGGSGGGGRGSGRGGGGGSARHPNAGAPPAPGGAAGHPGGGAPPPSPPPGAPPPVPPRPGPGPQPPGPPPGPTPSGRQPQDRMGALGGHIAMYGITHAASTYAQMSVQAASMAPSTPYTLPYTRAAGYAGAAGGAGAALGMGLTAAGVPQIGIPIAVVSAVVSAVGSILGAKGQIKGMAVDEVYSNQRQMIGLDRQLSLSRRLYGGSGSMAGAAAAGSAYDYSAEEVAGMSGQFGAGAGFAGAGNRMSMNRLAKLGRAGFGASGLGAYTGLESLGAYGGNAERAAGLAHAGGLRGPRAEQYLSAIASSVEQLSGQGMKLDVGAIEGLGARLFNTAGFKDAPGKVGAYQQRLGGLLGGAREQITAPYASMAQSAVMARSMRGARSPMDMLRNLDSMGQQGAMDALGGFGQEAGAMMHAALGAPLDAATAMGRGELGSALSPNLAVAGYGDYERGGAARISRDTELGGLSAALRSGIDEQIRLLRTIAEHMGAQRTEFYGMLR